MSDLLRGDDPAEALRIYIRAKLQSSRERPHGSRVFTREVMAGAPRFGQAIASQVGPALAADVQAFERWVAQGKIARVDFTHLMFILWYRPWPPRRRPRPRTGCWWPAHRALPTGSANG